MRKIILLLLVLALFSCKSNTKQVENEVVSEEITVTANEITEPILDTVIEEELPTEPIRTKRTEFINMGKYNQSKFQTELKPIVKDFIAKYRVHPPTEDLPFTAEIIDKYPSDIDFFENPIINARLKALTGTQYDEISRCGVESLIKRYLNDYALIHICFPHECGNVYCEIYLNYKTNNISLLFRSYSKLYCYSENGRMGVEFEQYFD